MAIKIIPLGERVLVKRILQPEKTQGGLFIPDSSRMNTSVAEIIFVSEDMQNGKLKEGDKVVVGRYTGVDISVEGEEFTLLKLDDVIGKIEETE